MLETKTIGELAAAGAVDGTELIEVEQAGVSRKVSADIPRIDDLDALVTLDPDNDEIRISQGTDDHRRMTVADFLVAAGISAYAEAIDVSAGDYDQASTAKKQIYSMTTAAASNDFNMLALASQEGCRVRIEKVDTGAGVGTVKPNGAETFLGGATAAPLRKQGDFIEYEVQGGVAIVIDSLSTLDSAGLAVNAIQTLPHGCAVIPRKYQRELVCLTADGNHAAGDVIHDWINIATANRDLTTDRDATNFYVITCSDGGGAAIGALNKTTKALFYLTMANWKIRFLYGL